MYNVYKIQVKPNEYLDNITTLTNNLYNVALYNVRQNYFKNKTYLNYYGNYPLCKENEKSRECVYSPPALCYNISAEISDLLYL